MTRCWVACYDISNDRRLRRVAKAMEGFGQRVQKSVFECWLNDEEFSRMRQAVEREMDRKADSLRLYALCEKCRELAGQRGGSKIDEPRDYYVV